MDSVDSKLMKLEASLTSELKNTEEAKEKVLRCEERLESSKKTIVDVTKQLEGQEKEKVSDWWYLCILFCIYVYYLVSMDIRHGIFPILTGILIFNHRQDHFSVCFIYKYNKVFFRKI